MNNFKVIQHSDRVEFKIILEEHLGTGWRVVTVTGAPMRSEDWFCAILERTDPDKGEERLARIADVISNKKRRNLTDADFNAIRCLSGGQDV